MRTLTEEEVYQADDLTREFVAVPEWANGDPEAGVYIRTMSGTERDQFEEDISKTKGKKTEINFKNIRARLVAMTACDENGKPIFTNIDKLGEKSSKALDRCFGVAQRLNGMTDKDVEGLAKN